MFFLVVYSILVCLYLSVAPSRMEGKQYLGYFFACLDGTKYFRECTRREDKIHLMSIYTTITTLILLWVLNAFHLCLFKLIVQINASDDISIFSFHIFLFQ